MVLLLGAYLLSSTYLFLELINPLFIRFNKKVKKIKKDDVPKVKSNNNLMLKLFDFISSFTSRFDNKKSISLKFIRAGSPFQWMGITEKNYTSFKWAATILVFFLVKDSKTSWGESILYAAWIHFFVEYAIYYKKKQRHKEIEQELDILISTTIECLEQGQTQVETFNILLNRIDKNNPLYEELLRVKLKIGIGTLDVKLDDVLTEMQDRIGMEEIDNYCLALKQYEIAGKAIKMLKKQLELRRSRTNFKQKRETQYKANLNSLATIILVACIVILVIVPMLIVVMQNPIFH